MRACLTWSHGTTPTGPFTLVDGAPNIRNGAAVRIVFFTGGGCTAPAETTTVVSPGNATDGVAITAHMWTRPSQGGFDCDVLYPWANLVTLGTGDGLSSPMVFVRDASQGAKDTLAFSVGAPPMGATCTGAKLGDPCALDCQCTNADARARCIPAANSGGVCAISCASDTECPMALPHCRFDGAPAFVCDNAPGNCKETYQGFTFTCPPTDRCPNGLCIPASLLPAQACKCLADCAGSGGRCADNGECVLFCSTLADCPQTAKGCTGGICQ